MLINTNKYDISMVRGDTLSFGIELEGLDQDLDYARFIAGKEYGSHDIVIDVILGDGIWKQDATHYGVRIPPEDTAALEGMAYYYDLEIGANGDVFTILHGRLIVDDDLRTEGSNNA